MNMDLTLSTYSMTRNNRSPHLCELLLLPLPRPRFVKSWTQRGLQCAAASGTRYQKAACMFQRVTNLIVTVHTPGAQHHNST